MVGRGADTTSTWVFVGPVPNSHSTGETDVEGADCGGCNTLVLSSPFISRFFPAAY